MNFLRRRVEESWKLPDEATVAKYARRLRLEQRGVEEPETFFFLRRERAWWMGKRSGYLWVARDCLYWTERNPLLPIISDLNLAGTIPGFNTDQYIDRDDIKAITYKQGEGRFEIEVWRYKDGARTEETRAESYSTAWHTRRIYEYLQPWFDS